MHCCHAPARQAPVPVRQTSTCTSRRPCRSSRSTTRTACRSPAPTSTPRACVRTEATCPDPGVVEHRGPQAGPRRGARDVVVVAGAVGAAGGLTLRTHRGLRTRARREQSRSDVVMPMGRSLPPDGSARADDPAGWGGVRGQGSGVGRVRAGPDRAVAGDVEGALVVADEREPVRAGPQVVPRSTGMYRQPPWVFNRWWRRHSGAMLHRRSGRRGWATTWSQSASCSSGRHPRAGRVHHGNTQVRSTSAAASGIRSGTSYGRRGRAARGRSPA